MGFNRVWSGLAAISFLLTSFGARVAVGEESESGISRNPRPACVSAIWIFESGVLGVTMRGGEGDEAVGFLPVDCPDAGAFGAVVFRTRFADSAGPILGTLVFPVLIEQLMDGWIHYATFRFLIWVPRGPTDRISMASFLVRRET